MAIEMEPIGIIHSAFTEPGQVRCGETAGVRATLEVFEQYLEGAADIKPGDKLQVYFHFHRSREAKLTVPLMGVGPMVGVFSSHSPPRPNFIGMTEVLVEAVEGANLTIVGADMIDGTPVLDMKPAPTKTER